MRWNPLVDEPVRAEDEPRASQMRVEDAVALASLDAQAGLLPYALAFFAIALPFYAWACSFAPDRAWMSLSFVVFAINWASFYAVIDWLKRHPETRADAPRRTRIHILGGLLWAAAIAQITGLGLAAGVEREAILLMAVGAAATCVFFSAPSLPALLIVGPAACAPPLLALFADDATRPTGRIMLAAVALVMALSLILNRLLRQMFALASEREGLIHDRDRSLEDSGALARSKSDLIATLSDEIRNGLTGVAHVLAAAAGKGGRSAPSREQLTAALTSAEELLGVLDATLDSETASAGRLTLERRPFDPGRLAREAALAWRGAAAGKGLELTVHVDENLITAHGAVVGDAARTRQIIASLIGNAVKYTMRGRVEVRVERLGETLVRLEVADTGPGLTPEELELAFQPFRRIERTGAGVPGAGLGLSLARQLCGLMGGSISVDSALGVGSCFRLDLPFDPAARAERPRAPDAEASDTGEGSRALKVLIADDDPLSTAMLRAVLEQLGHQVLHAQDGRRAVDLAQVCDIDLIMLGGQLAPNDGPQTIRALRALSGSAGQAPIIALIGGDADEAQACIQAGADDLLRKPISVAGAARAVAAVTRDDRREVRAVRG
jgi:signal transduction histidine kinase/ActR/RegA family two-component response regulator